MLIILLLIYLIHSMSLILILIIDKMKEFNKMFFIIYILLYDLNFSYKVVDIFHKEQELYCQKMTNLRIEEIKLHRV